MRLLAAILLCLAGTAQAIPMQAQQYRRALTQEAQRTWGLGAPVARFAAQVHQESGWRADAKSKYAAGLAQFTPSTAEWIAQVYPVEFDGIVAPYSPKWALRALVIYDRHLYVRTKGHTECDRWAMTLASYNMGAGNLRKEVRACASACEAAGMVTDVDRHARIIAENCSCDPLRWWGNVERMCSRADWACKESSGYPRRILYRWEPEYRKAGWPGSAVCSD